MTRISGGASGTSIIVGVIFTVVGAGVSLFVGKPTLDNARASAAWPKTVGKIVASQVAEQRNRGKRSYWADVHYTFLRDGREVIGKTLSFGASRSSARQSAEAIVARYPVGKEVDVYCNPLDDGVSVLEPGVTFSSYFALVLGIIFLGMGLLLTFIPLRSRLRSRSHLPAQSAAGEGDGPSHAA